MNITWCKVFGCTLKTFTTYQPIEVLNVCYKTEEVYCVKCGKVFSKKTDLKRKFKQCCLVQQSVRN